MKGSIFSFAAGDGTCRLAFRDLHMSPITAMVYVPDTDTLVTASADSACTVWRIAGGQPHRFCTFGKSIIHMVPDNVACPSLLLTAALDGTVSLVSLDSFQPLHRMRLPGPLGGRPSFMAGPDGRPRILLHVGTEVKLFSLQHLYEPWCRCNAACTALTALPGSGGLILAEFADSSVRLLDAHSQEVRGSWR
ncbi:uncharacterized protein HaLaN_20469 [Haematococcus lacustris]|uniref:Uncharacterized protein n=1 Tax=Haematococcus lacustris TaxID=44745 RepID=A0A699ZKY1_HAELA|nr:uncharacterized protein HaLaN_20469 [Haematococcus lacustris]